MTKIDVRQTIEAPAEKVWQTIRTFENPERFVPIVRSSTVQRSGDSTQRTCTVQFGDQEGKIVEQLQRVDDKDKVLEFTIERAPAPFAGLQTRYQVSALSNGTTELNISTELANSHSEFIQTIQGVYEMAADGLKKLHEKQEVKA